MSAAPALRIGILSTAKIAGEFMRGVKSSQKIDVTAVARRDAARGKQFARDHGIATVLCSYEALLADPSIEAIYNPLPNSLHAAWSIRALEAGKHVLCEKPLAMSAAEAREMFKVAARHGRHLVEAYPYRAQPLTRQLRRMLAAGAIGSVQSIQANFGFQMSDTRNIRLDAALGGGALMDAGCYPVSLIRMIAGESPTRVFAAARWVSAGVDQSIAATFEFDKGLLAQMSCSFGTAVHRHAFIVGSTGVIETNYQNTPPPGRPARLQIKRGIAWDVEFEAIEAPAINGFLAEAESFSDLVRLGPSHWSGATEEESIDIARMIDAIKRSARTGTVEPLAV